MNGKSLITLSWLFIGLMIVSVLLIPLIGKEYAYFMNRASFVLAMLVEVLRAFIDDLLWKLKQ